MVPRNTTLFLVSTIPLDQRSHLAPSTENHTPDRSDHLQREILQIPILDLRPSLPDDVEDLYGTDPTQKTCTKACGFYGSHPAA